MLKTESGSSKMEMKIFLVNPTIPQYAIECYRTGGDIQPFYAFFREFHSLLNNVSSVDFCKDEELADLSDELIMVCQKGNEAAVKMYLQNKDIDANRLDPVSNYIIVISFH